MTTRTEDAERLARAMGWKWMYGVPLGDGPGWSGFKLAEKSVLRLPYPWDRPKDHLAFVGELSDHLRLDLEGQYRFAMHCIGLLVDKDVADRGVCDLAHAAVRAALAAKGER